jgi:hypothetical protein
MRNAELWSMRSRVGAALGSDQSSISADGRFVAFASSAFNLVPGDTNRADDVFVRDRGAQAADTTTMSFDTPTPPGGPGPLDGVFQGPSTSVTVSFTAGWSLGVDDITYTTEP